MEIEWYNEQIEHKKEIDNLKCCGNCFHLKNRYFPLPNNILGAFLNDFVSCYHGEQFSPAANTLFCERGHYPKFVDNVCNEWTFDNNSMAKREID